MIGRIDGAPDTVSSIIDFIRKQVTKIEELKE